MSLGEHIEEVLVVSLPDLQKQVLACFVHRILVYCDEIDGAYDELLTFVDIDLEADSPRIVIKVRIRHSRYIDVALCLVCLAEIFQAFGETSSG